MCDPLLVVNGLVKSFNGYKVIDDLTFSVNKGDIAGLLGPNGSGKTTAVRLLNGVLHPDAGTVSIGGLDPVADGEAVRALSGVLTESADFYRHMSGLDNLLFFGRLYGVTDPRRSEELLEMFGLAQHRHKPVGTYSTGMRKRLGLAKALLHKPDVLFLDEPTNGLDPEGVRLVLNHIRDLNREWGTTILICSHLLNQTESVCHRYVFIDEGRLIEQGSLGELRERYRQRIQVAIEVDEVPEESALGDTILLSVTEGDHGDHRIVCSLEGVDDIPPLLSTLVRRTAVYGVHVIEPDLETLYFHVRGGVGRS